MIFYARYAILPTDGANAQKASKDAEKRTRGETLMAQARDKFWMFGVRAHQDDPWLGRSLKNRNYTVSRITPAEGAFMLDIPNMLMINCDGTPVPFSQEAYGYAESFVRMNKVLWGATGSGGFRVGNEEAFICKLAEKYPNIGGAFLDDLFHRFRGDPDANSKMKAFLHEIRCGLDKACRPMELYIVWGVLIAVCLVSALFIFSILKRLEAVAK